MKVTIASLNIKRETIKESDRREKERKLSNSNK